MPPKDISKKWHPTRQNAVNIPKPRKHSGMNPSLQPAEGQLNCAVKRTDTPMVYDNLLRSLDEASDSEMNNEYEGEVELEDGPSNSYFGRPVPSNQYSGQYAPQYYPPQCLPGPDKDEAGLSDQYSGNQYYLPQCLSPQHSVPPQLQNYEQPLQHYQALPHYQLPQHHEQQLMHFDNLPSSSPPPSMFNSTTDNYHQEDAFNNYYNHLPLHSFSDLMPPHIWDLQQPTTSTLRAPMNLPRIRKVFIYEPCRHPSENCQGQLIPMGVIRATGKTSVTAPVPSQRQLLPPYCPSSPMSPASGSEVAHPAPQPQLTNTELEEMMKEAKLIMRQMVLLENAMLLTVQNGEMAEKALLEAAARVASIMSLSQIPNHGVCCKTLTTITTTVCSVFKNEARSMLPDHYSLTPDSITDAALLMEHRQSIVAPLLLNQAYLFIQVQFPQSTTLPSSRQSTDLSGALVFMKC
ncbi:hypothetical protein DFH29DRAFT_1006341 [Suillus ampliporus]|nr:hypothetical protein DFH29DRAFT_1006341 [Suillus ampliporus]